MAPLTKSGLTRFAADEYRLHELFHRRSLESDNAVELASPSVALLRHGFFDTPLESRRFQTSRLSEGVLFAIRLRRNSVCIAGAIHSRRSRSRRSVRWGCRLTIGQRL